MTARLTNITEFVNAKTREMRYSRTEKDRTNLLNLAVEDLRQNLDLTRTDIQTLRTDLTRRLEQFTIKDGVQRDSDSVLADLLREFTNAVIGASVGAAADLAYSYVFSDELFWTLSRAGQIGATLGASIAFAIILHVVLKLSYAGDTPLKQLSVFRKTAAVSGIVALAALGVFGISRIVSLSPYISTGALISLGVALPAFFGTCFSIVETLRDVRAMKKRLVHLEQEENRAQSAIKRWNGNSTNSWTN